MMVNMLGRTVRSATVIGDLLDQMDDAVAELGLFDPRKGFYERKSVCGRQEFRDIVGNWGLRRSP